MRSFTRAGAVALVAALALTGCGRDSGDDQAADKGKGVADGKAKGDITVWALGAEGDKLGEIAKDFEAENPDAKVKVTVIPFDAAHDKISTSIAGGQTPDVSLVGTTWVSEFAASKALDPTPTDLIDKGKFFEGSWDTTVVNDTSYGVPWYVETRLPFYRRDLLQQAGIDAPPVNWDEWRTAMAAIKRQVGPKRYAILLPINEFEPLLNLAMQQPDPLLRDGGRYGNFRSAGFKRALAFYKEMFDKGWAPRLSNTQISNVWDEFGNGYFSFYINGPWNIAELRKRLPAELSQSWMTMPLPGPDGPGASVAGGTSFVIFDSSQHKEAAWKWIAYLSQSQLQARFHATTGDLPPRRSAWRSEALSNDVYARAYRDQLERAKPTPKVPEWERIATELRLVAEQMVAGRLTVDQAATELDRRADAILEKRRWMLDRRDAAAGQP